MSTNGIYNATKKEEAVELEIKRLRESEGFMFLSQEIQDRIISDLSVIGTGNNRKVLNEITKDQIFIYSLFALLIVFLIVNALTNFVHISILMYMIFYSIIMGTYFLVFIKRRKDRIDGINGMLENWDELPQDNKNDFVELIKNEIETNHESIIGKIAKSKIIKYLIYALLIFFIGKTIFEDAWLSPRLFYVTTLSILFIFILMTQVSVVDDLEYISEISQKDFLYYYFDKLSSNYRIITIFLIVFEILMIGYIMYNILVGTW